MREQPVILEHEADRAPCSLDELAGVRIVHHLPSQFDAAAGERDEPSQGAQQVDFPEPFGPRTPSTSPGPTAKATVRRKSTSVHLGINHQAVALGWSRRGAAA